MRNRVAADIQKILKYISIYRENGETGINKRSNQAKRGENANF